jgi:hypothetical protein
MMRRPRNLFEIRDWGFGSQVSVHEPDLPSEFFLYSIPSSVLYKEGAGGQGNGQAVGEAASGRDPSIVRLSGDRRHPAVEAAGSVRGPVLSGDEMRQLLESLIGAT